MHYAVKNIVFALSLFFAFYGMQTRAAMEMRAQSVKEWTTEGDPTHFDKGKLERTTGLLQPEEQLRLAQPRPSAPLKQVFSGMAALVWAQEFRLQLLAVHYLQRTRLFSPGLTIRDIIFPFHYFW
ncbi:hypothetical protein Q4E40_14255 [Pontibacter sp. BT731]|uniref:hypothetical protein n=1 Tax=Pontibacter coccineus TaxID=3063328 RepID=UPI0026E3D0E7|nr:hypothetical protein [Pontibacter sp. BT731]MDO6391299.1 hypothetical protein [Pontibacter sp. BT731]